MIPLHTYVDGFREGKLRPGFRVEDKLFVLTSVKPKTTYMTLAGSCCSGHFRSQGKKYVTLASNQEAFRYNNVVGGYLTLDAKRFERVFNVKLTSYLSTQTTAENRRVYGFNVMCLFPLGEDFRPLLS